MSGIYWSVFPNRLYRFRKSITDKIQCAKHSKKEEALEKLKAGAKFDDVAREFSEDKARAGRLIYLMSRSGLGFTNDIIGGALGWKGRGDLDPAFEEVAFELGTSTTANPDYREVKTGFGYHILMVEGRK
jgi:NIMA-interacting peptidyl-prolyl cis-trans isomerase 4